MEDKITESVIQTIAGTIEKLLLEKREGISDSYGKIGSGIKVSIGVQLDPSARGIEVNYTVSYPLEPAPEPALKETVKKKQFINEVQSELFDAIRNGKLTVSAGAKPNSGRALRREGKKPGPGPNPAPALKGQRA